MSGMDSIPYLAYSTGSISVIITILIILLSWSYITSKTTLENPFESVRNAAKRLVIRILQYGPIPSHIAFIMDGNRRYARKLKQDTFHGHQSGFQNLRNVLEMCLILGVKEVTVYAFSNDNFKRSKHEVDSLMNLACEKLEEFSTHDQLISEYGIAVRVVGDLRLLPPSVQQAAYNVMEKTRKNDKAILNICMPYSSRSEMTSALNGLAASSAADIAFGSRSDEEIISAFESHLWVKGVDLLVRTSGEIRLSDFLLWQVSDKCRIHFTKTLWPEFGMGQLLPILLSYQLSIFRGQGSNSQDN